MEDESPRRQELNYKILTIGDSGVGKTCLLLRFTEDKFFPTYLATIGIDYKAKSFNVDGKNVKLKIWDTAGQERFKNITQQYYKGADGILLVFDVCDKSSFIKLREWVQQIKTHTKRVVVVMIGNKCDKEDRVVSREEAEQLGEEFGYKYFDCSAFKNEGINESFYYLSQQLISLKDGEVSSTDPNEAPRKISKSSNKSINKGKGCCK